MTLQELLFKGKNQLKDAGIIEADNDAYELLFHVFGISRSDYVMRLRDCPSDNEIHRYLELINRRAGHEPLQYITGKAYFMGLEFNVTPDVLIPRFDSETLIEEVVTYIKKKKLTSAGQVSVMDMCSGSGCLLLSVLNELRDKAEGDHIFCGRGYDISEGALAVANGNAKKLEITAEFIKSDLFENVEGSYDVIISNPPYIRSDVIPGLDEEVKDHEPYLALDGGEDGLIFYREITRKAPEYLKNDSLLIYEIGDDQGEAVRDIMTAGGFTDVKVIKDLCGRDRVVRGELKK